MTWFNKHLEHIPNLVYLGVTWDRTLSYKEYIQKSAKHPLGTISLGSYRIQNGEPGQQPSKQQLLHSATLRKNMRVLCGKDRNT